MTCNPGNPAPTRGPGNANGGRRPDRGSLLLVDDEPTLRRLTASFLQEAGFEVIEAADGEQALERFHHLGGRVRAALLDLTMPGLGGGETALALRRLCPGLPILILSGLAEEDVFDQLPVGVVSGFVQKPYTYDGLVGKVDQVLAG